MQTATIYNHETHESKTLGVAQATHETRMNRAWSFDPPPPPGWERETPRYKAIREVHPSAKQRHRFEPPFSSVSDSDMWQYADRTIRAGEIVDTKEWPHPSFRPLNYAAQKVLDFFNSRQKSRLPQSPWQGDSVRLSDGLSGPGITKPVLPRLPTVGQRAAS